MYVMQKMTEEYALEISRWVYENEYSIYSFEANAETIDELLNGDYFACTDAHGQLAGYFCQGRSARIPTQDGFSYSNDRMDIGLGMHPARCGQGRGYDFVLCGIKYLTQQRPDTPLRLTVACFNQRAISLYHQLGFTIERTVVHKITGKPFYVMIR